MRVSSLLPQYGFCRASSGHQAGLEARLPAKPSYQPLSFFYGLDNFEEYWSGVLWKHLCWHCSIVFPRIEPGLCGLGWIIFKVGCHSHPPVKGDTLTMYLTTWLRSRLLGFLFFKVILFLALRECHNLEENYKVWLNNNLY